MILIFITVMDKAWTVVIRHTEDNTDNVEPAMNMYCLSKKRQSVTARQIFVKH